MPESEPEKEHSWVTQMQPGRCRGMPFSCPGKGGVWGPEPSAIQIQKEMSGPGVPESTALVGSQSPHVLVTSSAPRPCGEDGEDTADSVSPLRSETPSGHRTARTLTALFISR